MFVLQPAYKELPSRIDVTTSATSVDAGKYSHPLVPSRNCHGGQCITHAFPNTNGYHGKSKGYLMRSHRPFFKPLAFLVLASMKVNLNPDEALAHDAYACTHSGNPQLARTLHDPTGTC